MPTSQSICQASFLSLHLLFASNLQEPRWNSTKVLKEEKGLRGGLGSENEALVEFWVIKHGPMAWKGLEAHSADLGVTAVST